MSRGELSFHCALLFESKSRARGCPRARPSFRLSRGVYLARFPFLRTDVLSGCQLPSRARCPVPYVPRGSKGLEQSPLPRRVVERDCKGLVLLCGVSRIEEGAVTPSACKAVIPSARFSRPGAGRAGNVDIKPTTYNVRLSAMVCK